MDHLGEALIRINIELADGNAQQRINEFFGDFRKQAEAVLQGIQELNAAADSGISIDALRLSFNELVEQLSATGTSLGTLEGDLAALQITSRTVAQTVGASAQTIADGNILATETLRTRSAEEQAAARITRLVDPTNNIVSNANTRIQAIQLEIEEIRRLAAQRRATQDGNFTTEGFDADRGRLAGVILENTGLGDISDENNAVTASTEQLTGAEAERLAQLEQMIIAQEALIRLAEQRTASDQRRRRVTSGALERDVEFARNPELISGANFQNISQIANELDESSSHFSAVQARLTELTRGFNTIERAIDPFTSAIRENRERLDEARESLREFYGTPTAEATENTNRIIELREELGELEDNLANLRRVAASGTAGVDLSSAFDDTTSSIQRVEGEIEGLIDQNRELDRSFERINETVEELDQATRDDLVERTIRFKQAAGQLNDAGELIASTDFSGIDPEHLGFARQIDELATQTFNERLQAGRAGQGRSFFPRIVAQQQLEEDLRNIQAFAAQAEVSEQELARATQQANRQFQSATGFLARLDQEASQAAQSFRQMGFTISDAGRQLSFFAIGALSQIGVTLQQFAQFEQSVVNVAAVLDDFEGFSNNVDSLSESFLRLGEVTEFTANEIAGAARELALAGFSVNEIRDSISGVISLASAGNLDPKATAGIFSNILRAFNIEAANAVRVADVLGTIATQSNTTVESLGESFKLLAPISASVGQSLEETAAALGVLGDAGIKGSRAGTGLSRAFSELLEKSDAFDAKLQSVGSSFDAIDPTRVGLTDIIAELERLQTAGRLTTADFFELFDQRSARVIVTLINQGASAFNDLTDSANNSADAAQKIRDKRLDTLFGDFRILLSSVQTLLIEVGASFNDIGRLVVQTAGEISRSLARFISQNPTIARTFALLTTSIGAATLALAGLALSIGGILRGLAGLTQLRVIIAGMNGWATANATVTTSNVALATSTGGVTAAVRALGVALLRLLRNPIFLVIGGITLLISHLNILSKRASSQTSESFQRYADRLTRTADATNELSLKTARLRKDLDLLRDLPNLNELQLLRLTEPGSLLETDFKAAIANSMEQLQNAVNDANVSGIAFEGDLFDQALEGAGVPQIKSLESDFRAEVAIEISDDGSEAAKILKRIFDSKGNVRTEEIDLFDLHGATREFIELGLLIDENRRDLIQAQDTTKTFTRAYSNGIKSVSEEIINQSNLITDLTTRLSQQNREAEATTDPARKKQLLAQVVILKAQLEIREGIRTSLKQTRDSSKENFDLNKAILDSKKQEGVLIAKINAISITGVNKTEENIKKQKDLTEELKQQTILTGKLIEDTQSLITKEKLLSDFANQATKAFEGQAGTISDLRESRDREGRSDVENEIFDQNKEFKAQLGTQSLEQFFRVTASKTPGRQVNSIRDLSEDELQTILGEETPLSVFDQAIAKAQSDILVADEKLSTDIISATAAFTEERNKVSGRLALGISNEDRIEQDEADDLIADLDARQDAAIAGFQSTRDDNVAFNENVIKESNENKLEFEKLYQESLNKIRQDAAEKQIADQKERDEELLEANLENQIKIAEITGNVATLDRLNAQRAERERERRADELIGTSAEIAGNQELIDKREAFIKQEEKIFNLSKEQENQKKKEDAAKKNSQKLTQKIQEIEKQREALAKSRLEVQKSIRDTFLKQASSLREVIALTKFLGRQEAIRQSSLSKIRKQSVNLDRRANARRRTPEQRREDLSRLGALVDRFTSLGGGSLGVIQQLETLERARNNFNANPLPPRNINTSNLNLPVAGNVVNNNQKLTIEKFEINIVADSISDSQDVLDAIQEREVELRKLLFGM